MLPNVISSQQNYIQTNNNIKSKLKQKQWNQRFAVASGIPQYSPQKQNPTNKSYRRLLQSKESRRSKSDLDNGLQDNQKKQKFEKIQKKDWVQKKKQAFQERVQLENLMNNSRISSLIKELQRLWIYEKVPQFYCYYWLSKVKKFSIDQFEEAIYRQTKTLKSRQSFYHQISKSIQARQISLLEQKRLLDIINGVRQSKNTLTAENQIYLNQKLSQLSQQITQYRKLTIYIIERIKKWKQYLILPNAVSERVIYYFDDNQNYLLKILSDTNFYSDSILVYYLTIATKNDPFLLKPLKTERKQFNQKYIKAFEITQEMKLYAMKNLEYLAIEKSEELKGRHIKNKIKQAQLKQTYKAPTKNQEIQQNKYRSGDSEENYKSISRQKADRDLKNKDKISLIRNVYETKKLNEQVTSQSYNSIKNKQRMHMKSVAYPKSKQNGNEPQTDFQLFYNKLQKQILKKKSIDRSASKNKTQTESIKQAKNELQNLVEVLKRNRIKQTKEETSNQNVLQQKKSVKINSDLYNELKTQILNKIKKQADQKQQLHKQNLLNSQKKFQQIKNKIKRETQQKFRAEKKLKQLERQTLEEKLRSEEGRLIEQRKNEINMELKVNQQIYLQQIKKIKEKSLNKQKKLKQVQTKQTKKEAVHETGDLNKQLIERQMIKIKNREQRQLEQLRRQNQIKQNILKQKLREQQMKKQQIQIIINSDSKQPIQRREYKIPSNTQIEDAQRKVYNQLQEKAFKEKIQNSIEKQIRIDLLKKTKAQLQSTERQKAVIIEQLYSNQSKQLQSNALNRNESELHKQSFQKSIIERRLQKQSAKNQLRQQFQRELLGSTIFNRNQDFIIKDIELYKDDLFLNSKMQEVPILRTEEDRQVRLQKTKTTTEFNIQKLPVIERIHTDISQKKSKSSTKSNYQSKVETLQKIKNNQSRKNKIQSSKVFSKTIKQSSNRKLQTQEAKGSAIHLKNNKNKKQPQKQLNTNKNTPNKKLVNEQISEKSPAILENKIPEKFVQNEIIENKYTDGALEQVDKKNKNSKRKSNKKVIIQKQFETSDQEIMVHKNKKSRKSHKKQVSREQSEEQEPVQKLSQKVNKYEQKLQKNRNQEILEHQFVLFKDKVKYVIELEAIQQGELDEYLNNHFIQLPKQQYNILIFNRQQLYRKLMEEVTFSLIVARNQGKMIGLCIAYHDRNKEDSRTFYLIHIGTYKNENHFDFIITISNFIFKKDPCDEIQFSYQFDQSKQEQLQFSNQFNLKFDKYGPIYQKKTEEAKFQRKYILKRPFNIKCDVSLGSVNKHSFINLFGVSAAVVFSDVELALTRQQQQISNSIFTERQISYAVMISEIFRYCLTPDQAQNLKNKVKQYARLKELLTLVVMLQKKKIKLDEIKLTEYKSVSQLNMKLLSQGKDLIKVFKDPASILNRVFFCQLHQTFRLPFHFQTAFFPLEDDNKLHHISYFRLNPITPHKLFTIKSSLYTSELHILPTQNSKYKIFVISAHQFNDIKDKSNLDLFMYIRLFLRSVKQHSLASWKYVWIPEIIAKQNWGIREFKGFLDKDIYILDSLNISYKQFIPGGMLIKPSHKDLVITPPLIIGILSMTLEQVSQGSPLYVRLVNLDSLKIIETIQNH